MKRTAMTVAMLGLFCGTALVTASPKVKQPGSLDLRTAVSQGLSSPQEQAKTFTGTIAKNGEKFVLRDDASKAFYDLDDQQSAGKFAGKRVRVTGTLDTSNNTIRVQTIEDATA